MAIIRELLGKTPQLGENTFVAETAVIIGDVTMGKDCSIWYNAVLRGDVHFIKMGDKVNVQDNAMIHCTYQKSPTTIGNNVSIGHNAIVHGCTIKDNVLIGMGAILLDYAEVGEGAIVAAGALVLSNTKIPPYTLWAGVPAKYVKDVEPEQTNEMNRKIAHNYAMYSAWYKDELTEEN